MSGPTVAIAPVPLARSGRRLAVVPVIFLVAGAVAVGTGLLRTEPWGLALLAAGTLVALQPGVFEVPLFWQASRLAAPIIDQLSDAVMSAARAALAPSTALPAGPLVQP